LGRIISFLKESGQYDNTLMVVTADHGDMLGDHFMWGKQHVYDPSYRIPLIIRDPENPEQHGQSVDALTETIDLAPTILDVCGRNAPLSMDGCSLKGFLGGRPPTTWKDGVHMELEFGDPVLPKPLQSERGLALRESNLAILREDRFKLVHFNGNLPPLLFDLQNDPDEMCDLASSPAHQETLLRMTRKLLSLRMSHADRTLSEMKTTEGGVINYLPD